MEIKDLGLYFDEILVIGDIHMGYEEAINKSGVLLPRAQFKDTEKRLKKLLEGLKIETIVINGDLKHEFGRISETEWRYTLRILDLLLWHCKKVVLIEGNHDKILGPIAEKRNVEFKKYFVHKDVYICHGDKIPRDPEFKKAKKVVIGHEHPAVSLEENGRVEVYKCFLFGKWKDKELIVMPSFNLVTEGTNVLKEELLSPFLKQDLDEFKVIVIDNVGNKYEFGKVKEIEC